MTSRRFLAALLLVVVACGDQPAKEKHRLTEPVTVGLGPFTGLIERVLAGPNVFDAPPSREARELHNRVFADGQVTFEEYRQGVQANVDCIAAEGFDVEGPLQYGSGGMLVVQAGVDPRTYLTYLVINPSSGLDPVAERCDAQWRYYIERVWLHQNAPSEEEIEAYLRRAWECARENGIPIPAEPDDSDLGLVVFPGSGCEPWASESDY